MKRLSRNKVVPLPRQFPLSKAAKEIERQGKYPKLPSRSTMTNWCRKGAFPNAERIGDNGQWLISEQDILDFSPPAMGRPTQ